MIQRYECDVSVLEMPQFACMAISDPLRANIMHTDLIVPIAAVSHQRFLD